MYIMNEAGSHHGYDNTGNQDAVLCRSTDRHEIMVLADGVSTCSRSGTGAKITCDAVAELLLDHADRFLTMNTRETANCLVSHILHRLREEADRSGIGVEEYSSTAACILLDKQTRQMLYFSIGDSLIVATRDDGCGIVAMPADSRRGCCVTTTGSASQMAKVGVVDTADLRSVTICSDGAWHLMYHRNRMYPEVRQVLIDRDFDTLQRVLTEKERFDDCSFVAVDLTQGM